MVLLDTNILIYIANGTLSPNVLKGKQVAYASIVRVEALGYAHITKAQEYALLDVFAQATEYHLNEAVIQRAITLRQQKRMTLGDAIIAATALEHGCELWTANTDDFKKLEGLMSHNPLELKP